MKIAVTGHRSEKLEDEEAVATFLRNVFHVYEANQVICGMANGTDLIGGTVALDMEISVVAAKPWSTHKPRKADADAYDNIVANAVNVVNVVDADRYLGPWVYQKRNEWMVDHADMVAAVWDGSPSGTKNCVDYAIKRNMDIIRLNPLTNVVSVRNNGWWII